MLDRMTACAISLGGNLGDVPRTFEEALLRLAAADQVHGVRQSRLYHTAPMGASAGDPFLNAAAVFETSLPPGELLDLLQGIEQQCGRLRTIRWGPRTLDLDLLLFGEEIITSPRLTVPHPALWFRRFVLDPLAELLPDGVHPVFRESIEQIRHPLLERPLPVGWAAPAQSFLSQNPFPSQNRMPSARADVRWLAGDDPSAAIVFAASDSPMTSPRRIRLPDDEQSWEQFVTDVLTAALDEPVPCSTRVC